jgi:hypothetical protein
MKNKYISKNVEFFLNSSLFKTLLFLLVIMSLLTVINCKFVPIIDSISYVFSDNIFLFLCIFPMFLFINIFLYDSFEKNIFLIVRLKDKKHYLKELFKNILVTITLMFLIIIVMVVIMENIFNFNGYNIVFDTTHNCINIVYMFFVILKLYTYIVLTSVINTMLLMTINKKLVIILNFLFFAFSFVCGYTIISVNSIKEISIFLGNYLLNNMMFSNFWFEFIYNLLMICVLFIITIILYILIKKSKKDVG